MPGSAIGEPPCSGPARCYGAAISLSRERIRFVAAALIGSAAGLLFLVVTVCPATTLATPHSLMTTMMAPAPIIAFIAGDRIVRHFGPREKTLLAALWSMPLASRNVAPVSLIPLGVPVTLAVFVLILRRSEHFAAPVAFSTASAKMTGRRHDIAPLQS
jgi:alpha-1,2-mannosyltransferase